VLGLHLAKAAEVGLGDRVEVARRVGNVALGRRGPLLQVAEDLRRLVVERAHLAVLGAAAHQPDVPVLLGEIGGEAAYRRQRPLGVLDVAVRAVGRHVAVQPVAAQLHSVHRVPV
jgi:hypothetical protein